MPKGHNSGKNESSMTYVKYDYLQVMETITGKFHQNPLKMKEELRRQELLLIKWLKLTKGHNSGKKESNVTSV